MNSSRILILQLHQKSYRQQRHSRSFIVLDFVWMVPVIGGLSYFFFPYGLLSFLLIIPVLLLGRWQYKTTGFTIRGEQVTIVSRNISRVTFFAEKKRLQIVQSSQNYFQKRKQLASVRVVVMSGMNGASAKASHMEQSRADEIAYWYEQ